MLHFRQFQQKISKMWPFYKMVIDDNNTDVFVCAHLFGNSFKNRISKEVIADDSIAFSRGSSESPRRALLVVKRKPNFIKFDLK